MDAVGIIIMGAGAFLLYEAVKPGGGHPWTLFTQVLGASAPAPAPTAAQTPVITAVQGLPSIGNPVG